MNAASCTTITTATTTTTRTTTMTTATTTITTRTTTTTTRESCGSRVRTYRMIFSTTCSMAACVPSDSGKSVCTVAKPNERNLQNTRQEQITRKYGLKTESKRNFSGFLHTRDGVSLGVSLGGDASHVHLTCVSRACHVRTLPDARWSDVRAT